MKQLKSPRFCYSGIIFSHIVCRQINIRRYNAHVVNISFKVIKNATSGNALVKCTDLMSGPKGGGGSLVNLNFVNLHSEIPKTCLMPCTLFPLLNIYMQCIYPSDLPSPGKFFCIRACTQFYFWSMNFALSSIKIKHVSHMIIITIS